MWKGRTVYSAEVCSGEREEDGGDESSTGRSGCDRGRTRTSHDRRAARGRRRSSRNGCRSLLRGGPRRRRDRGGGGAVNVRREQFRVLRKELPSVERLLHRPVDRPRLELTHLWKRTYADARSASWRVEKRESATPPARKGAYGERRTPLGRERDARRDLDGDVDQDLVVRVPVGVMQASSVTVAPRPTSDANETRKQSELAHMAPHWSRKLPKLSLGWSATAPCEKKR